MSSVPKTTSTRAGICNNSPSIAARRSLGSSQHGRLLAFPRPREPKAASILYPSTARAFATRATATTERGPGALTQSNTHREHKSSTKSQKSGVQTPSQALLAALKDRGLETGVYEPKEGNVVDFSWVNPNDRAQRKKHKEAGMVEQRQQPTEAKVRMAYATIVARYIRHVEPLLRLKLTAAPFDKQRTESLDLAVAKVFNDDTVQYLSSRGYCIEDVVSWAWILKSKMALTAAKRYIKLENHKRHGEGSTCPIPPFVFLFILRREHISAEALGLLLPIAANMLGKQPDYNASSDLEVMRRMHEELMQPTAWDRNGDNTTAMIIIVRLLRAARNVSPPALLPVADIFTSTFGSATITKKTGVARDKAYRHLTSLYNQCIVLISEPCRIHPYQSVTFQHRAAFQLLREMTKFRPAITVTRKAYQAIIRIQAAREKSAPEREWEDLKSPSWPPWKQERLGIDAERGQQGSESLTIKAMGLMAKSGYAMTRWEKVAGIVGGWDTDGTPTIQTRTILPRPNKFQTDEFHQGAQKNSHPDIWAARIRATRTLNEAWACFLGYRAEQSLLVDTGVYMEMIQKLAYGERLQRHPGSTKAPSNAFPGDGKEVLQEPSSPRNVLYVPSNPPTLHGFVREMLDTDIKLSKRLLILLLAHVDFNAGRECLSRSILTQEELNCVSSIATSPKPHHLWHLSQIEEDVFAAVVNFFGRTFDHQTSEAVIWKLGFPIAFSSRSHDHNSSDFPVQRNWALLHICHLMRLRLPRSPQTWNIFLSHLISQRAEYGRRVPKYLQPVIAWIESREVVRWMDRENIPLDMDTLQILCRSLSRVIRAHLHHEYDIENRLKTLQHRELFGQHTAWAVPHEPVPALIRDGVGLIKRRFYQMASQPSPAAASALPKPLPAQIHAFVQVLGLAGDHDGLLTVLWWISKSEAHLKPILHESLNGTIHMRRAMIAIRVFLEGHLDSMDGTPRQDVSDDGSLSGDSGSGQPAQRVLPERHIETAYDIFQKSKFLESWPTDQEVREYAHSSPGYYYRQAREPATE